MLLPLDKDRVLRSWVSPDHGGLQVIDRFGKVTLHDIGGHSGRLKLDCNRKLILSNEFAAYLVEPESGFTTRVLKPSTGSDRPRWSTAFLGLVVDSESRLFSRFSLDRAALNLADPGYTEPTDATLLPCGNEVAVTIVRSAHMAIFNLATGETRLVELAGSFGNSNTIVHDDRLWVVNYDTLCRIDLGTLQATCSPKLQPPRRDPKHGGMIGGFVGGPVLSKSLGGWLIPRPYSGDVLLVSKETLQPERRWPCGGKPYELAEFDDGALIVADHPSGTIRTANTTQFVKL